MTQPNLAAASDTDVLSFALSHFAQLSEKDIQLAMPCWKLQVYKKGETYNAYKSVCRYLGFITQGYFRSYMTDPKNGKEKNIFIYPVHQFVVTFKSFIHQIPCDYHTQALTDARVLCISLPDLLNLYKQSHGWERFGRLAAQEAFNVAIDRAESMLFKTPEERYLHLMKHQPDMFNALPLYHISSYLGIEGASLSRIRKRISGK
jgi:CRP-like cAMP-binding protein